MRWRETLHSIDVPALIIGVRHLEKSAPCSFWAFVKLTGHVCDCLQSFVLSRRRSEKDGSSDDGTDSERLSHVLKDKCKMDEYLKLMIVSWKDNIQRMDEV